MGEFARYALALAAAAAALGGIFMLLRPARAWRFQLPRGTIRGLQRAASRILDGSDPIEGEDELLRSRPVLYGIPYLAWILSALVIAASLLILFYENLFVPYSTPPAGTVAWISYRAPAPFGWQGRELQRHDVLVAREKVITEEDRLLIDAGLANRRYVGAPRVLGTLLLVSIFVFILLFHINSLSPTTTEKNKSLILIHLTMLAVLVSAKVSLYYGVLSPYLIPVPWAGMMIAILINRRIVPLTVLMTLILVSLLSTFDFVLFLVLLAGGLVSGAWMRQVRKRSELMLASLLLGMVMALVLVCAAVVANGSFRGAVPDAVLVLANGIGSGLLTLILLPFVELVFDFASPFRLMELLDLNTSVLKEFFFKAPGTYQHTMAVANIGESVAAEIGADGLLVRVGAYYHDIGKMFNPHFFIENQPGRGSPHESLGPVASASVIRSHVILGVRLARQMKLPTAVVDFITTHHGTSRIERFYQESKQLGMTPRSRHVFHYPGPQPYSRETGIVMIVDSVEAAFRNLRQRDEQSIRALVSSIATAKLEAGQLDDSGLSIGELKKIIDTLTHILKSSAHQRVKYPPDRAGRAGDSVLPVKAALRVVPPRA